jgi:hypothetical protein
LNRQFFEEDQLAGRDLDAVHPVANQRDLAAEDFAEARGDRRERVGFRELPFLRPAEVRGHHHRRALVERHADAGRGRADARVVRDAAVVVLRDVEVGADEDTLAGQVEVGHAQHLHVRMVSALAWARARAASSVAFSSRVIRLPVVWKRKGKDAVRRAARPPSVILKP